MRMSPLGRSGLQVSRIALGTMMFGGVTPPDEARSIFEAARESGVNFIDTADTYSQGESERLVGEFVRNDRHAWVVATKAGSVVHNHPNGGGNSRKWLLHALDRSLARLGFDHVDVWYLHREDFRTPLEETVAAVGAAIAAGKVRYWGFSNFSAWKAVEFVRIADALGVPYPIVAQPFYNIMNRTAEADYIPACHHHGVGVVAYAALARGVLTGKYSGAEAPEGSRVARGDRRILEIDLRAESMALARELAVHATSRGMSLGEFAIAWVLGNRAVTGIVAGPRTLAQWQPYADAANIVLTSEDEALVDRLVAPGHPSTPGFTDPRYPVLGRFPACKA